MAALNRKIFALVALAALGFAGAVGAATDYQDSVKDNRGYAVRDTAGNCVRTKWSGEDSACEDAVPVPVPPVPAVRPQSAKIFKADRTVYFKFGKADLSPQARARLDALASRLRTSDDVQSARAVGFADRIGRADANLTLSQRRAEAVRRYMVAHRYSNMQNTEIRWQGEGVPTTQCGAHLAHTALVACLQNDRRVEVEISYRAEQQISDAQH